jgi:glycosyltransferase involved in cell wall biosynthesis
MKLLVVHNRYQQPGGEDTVFRAEGDLLRRAGHQLVAYVRHNDDIAPNGFVSLARLAMGTVWARESYRAIRNLIRREKPDVAHFHNTFPLISPSAYYACREASVPVVQSLHNPRLLCPAATLYRKHTVCEECVGKIVPWPGVAHGCYRNSRLQTGVVAAMLTFHRLLGTWHEQVDTFVVFTEFYRRKFVKGGVPAEKIVLKPHFVHPDPGVRSGRGDYALLVGRLAEEKGIPTVLAAWKKLKQIPLKVRGDGPLLPAVQAFGTSDGVAVEWVPRLSKPALASFLKGARFLVWPSQGFYETFGLVAVEAFACGVPVIASRLGAMEEIVEDGRTGLHFTPGDADDLAAKVEWAWSHPKEMEAMGREARAEYEAKYTAERNYEMLMDIYRRAMENHNQG